MAPRHSLHHIKRLTLLAALTAGILAAACVDVAGGNAVEMEPGRTQVGRTGDASVIVQWNELAHEIAFAEDKYLTFKGQRALAMMNLAMHDALNTVAPRYRRYAYTGGRRTADAEQAAAQAARAVLAAQYPNRVARLDSLWAAQRKDAGPELWGPAEALGVAAANAILSARLDDGWDNAGTYTFVNEPGQYQTTPGWNGFVLQPGFRNAKPFALRAPHAFRPPPPPPLRSAGFARAYEEVKLYGALSAADRTADQSAYAIFWLEFAEGSINRLTRQLVLERSVDAWSAARLFALMHMALYDGYIATWDAKYEYNHWRPITAIRAGTDVKASTQPDTQWQSLLPAPPFPEYVSAHATGCAGSLAVLASFFSDNTSFSMTTTTAPVEMNRRSFTSFSAAADECADSRVRLGWHFRYSTDAGLQLGRRVAEHVLRTQLLPESRRHQQSGRTAIRARG